MNMVSFTLRNKFDSGLHTEESCQILVYKSFRVAPLVINRVFTFARTNKTVKLLFVTKVFTPKKRLILAGEVKARHSTTKIYKTVKTQPKSLIC